MGSRCVLIAGANGQLGRALQQTAPAHFQIVPAGRDVVDITAPEQVRAVVIDERPDVIVNAAAYTDVDGAENECDLAFAVNTDGAGHLAMAARRTDAHFVHLSTDFVFDGSQSRPYTPEDLPNPINTYGRSKYAGEQQVQEILGEEALILRTAWLYGGGGHDFLQTMLRLMRSRRSVEVVADVIGTPTEVTSLARTLWKAVDENLRGIHHWTNAGVASWYDFAVAIADEAKHQELIDEVHVTPITSEEFPRPAPRPPYTVLDKHRTWRALNSRPRHWTYHLREALRPHEGNEV